MSVGGRDMGGEMSEARLLPVDIPASGQSHVP